MSDQGDRVWVTVVTRLDDATDVADDLAERLDLTPVVETSDDILLNPNAGWYRAALQQVSDIGLDVIQARGTLPISEYEAFESPADAAVRLMGYLNGVSGSYRRGCSRYEEAEAFWLAFFRRGPAPDLSRPGRLLWNLAG